MSGSFSEATELLLEPVISISSWFLFPFFAEVKKPMFLIRRYSIFFWNFGILN